MQTKSALNTLTVAVMTLFLASILIPATNAQGAGAFTSSFTLKTPTAPKTPIVPDSTPLQITVPWTYSFQNQEITLATIVAGTATLHWSPAPKCDNNAVTITGSFAEPITFNSVGATTTQVSYSDTSTFYVAATLDAPGETLITCKFTGYVDAVNSQIPQTSAADTNAQVTVQYVGLISTTVPTTIDQAGPQNQITYQVEMTNLGNSRSNINFNIVDTHSGDGWNPVAPSQFILEARQQGAATYTKTANFLVSTPYHNGWINKETTFVLKIQPSSTKADLKGNEVSVNVLARVRGIYVPGPEPLLMVGAILGTALLVRLRKVE